MQIQMKKPGRAHNKKPDSILRIPPDYKVMFSFKIAWKYRQIKALK